MAEKKYIELEAVLSEIDEWYEMYPESDVAREALALAKSAIRKIPAADVVPVRHGRWIEDGYYDEPCVCSYCGARMDMVTDCNQVKDGDGE